MAAKDLAVRTTIVFKLSCTLPEDNASLAIIILRIYPLML